ncbi:MAG: hypothetical protein H7315_04065 [Herminiimonas sp.]|nr:hypothetical protein [Herminiimonas sp.]
MKTLHTGLLSLVALLMLTVGLTTIPAVSVKPMVMASADMPLFAPLTQDLTPLIDLLN